MKFDFVCLLKASVWEIWARYGNIWTCFIWMFNGKFFSFSQCKYARKGKAILAPNRHWSRTIYKTRRALIQCAPINKSDSVNNTKLNLISIFAYWHINFRCIFLWQFSYSEQDLMSLSCHRNDLFIALQCTRILETCFFLSQTNTIALNTLQYQQRFLFISTVLTFILRLNIVAL